MEVGEGRGRRKVKSGELRYNVFTCHERIESDRVRNRNAWTRDSVTADYGTDRVGKCGDPREKDLERMSPREGT